MSNSFIIELDEEAVGLIVREGGAYAFHAVNPAFSALEGHLYPDALTAERAARRHHRRASAAAAAARVGLAA
jgi:hypothetical protein